MLYTEEEVRQTIEALRNLMSNGPPGIGAMRFQRSLESAICWLDRIARHRVANALADPAPPPVQPQPERLTVDDYEFCTTCGDLRPGGPDWFHVPGGGIAITGQTEAVLFWLWARPKRRPDMVAGGTFAEKGEG